MFTISSHANGLRTCEVRHAVQHAYADGDLGRLRVDTPCPQAVTCERLQSFTLAVDLHARAADHQMDRFAIAGDRQLDLECLRTAAQGCVVRHGQGGESQVAQALREALQRAQQQAKHGIQAQQCLDQRVAVEARASTLRLGVRCARKCGFIDPHRDVTSVDQASVVGRPVPDAVARFRLARLAPVPTHHLGKNRESTQELDLLTAAPQRLLRVYVNTLRSRRIYATTPINSRASGYLS
ncbi:protein of unknown function [Burkholderia multivorans]